MSTAQERNARADKANEEFERSQKDETTLPKIVQACEDALIDIQSPAVLRVRAFIRTVSLESNPDPIMMSWAKTWLKSTDALIEQAQKAVAQKRLRDAEVEDEDGGV